MTLNEELKKLKHQVASLQSKVNDLSQNVEGKTIQPYSKVNARDLSQIKPIDPIVGRGKGNLPWNDSELEVPPINQQPSAPTKGYNKHGHSRYAGGALDISTLELVEYDFGENGYNKHCQQFWMESPSIVKYEKTPEEGQEGGEPIEAIGSLDGSFVFDPNAGKFRIYAVYKEDEEE